MRSARPNPHTSISTGKSNVGQSFLEFAVSLVGIVVFVYVVLNVWVWLTGTLQGRQASFQATRLAAGQISTAGAPVPYQRPPIHLVGAPGSAGGRPGPDELDLIPRCEAGEPFIAEAQRLLEEGNELKAQAEQKAAEARDLAAQAEAAAERAQDECTDDDDDDDCEDLAHRAQALANQAQQASQEAGALAEAAMDKYDQAQDQAELARQACE